MKEMDWGKLLQQERLLDPSYTPKLNRPLFAQDADRIVFSAPFRRLANKTQVHPLYDNDHVHHRLIHSVETSMVGRSLGLEVGHWLEAQKHFERTEDTNRFSIAGTVQAACLAHDIGNPPFGHSGEDAIGDWFAEYLDDKQGALTSVKDGIRDELCEFEGNAQGFRLIANLEMYRQNGGMRLSLPVLGAFQKYPARARTSKSLGKETYVGLKKSGVFEAEWPIFEGMAQKLGLFEENSDNGSWYRRHPLVYLVEAADDICYQILDLEDAFTSGDLTESAVIDALKPIANPNNETDQYSPEQRISYYRAVAIGNAISSCVEAFKMNYKDIMAGQFNSSLVEASDLSQAFSEISTIAKRQIFTARRKTELEVSGRNILRRVLSGILPIYENLALKKWNVEEISSHHTQVARAMNLNLNGITNEEQALHELADFVSGMTDRYAVKASKIVSGIY